MTFIMASYVSLHIKNNLKLAKTLYESYRVPDSGVRKQIPHEFYDDSVNEITLIKRNSFSDNGSLAPFLIVF